MRSTWLALVLGGCASHEGSGDRATPVVDLRADSNRDGEVRFDDSDANKTEWNASVGAVFLANIDDDAERCPRSSDDETIALCNDAADDVVNGPDDARDLARLLTRPWPEAPPGTVGRLHVAPAAAKDLVRLFKRTGARPTDFEPIDEGSVLSAREIAAGIELAIEAKDVVRDRTVWDGYVDVTFTVTTRARRQAEDTVRLRVAPVLTFHHLLPAETVWMADNAAPSYQVTKRDIEASAIAAGVGFRLLDVSDQWAQDYFEPAFMSMPAEGGRQHVIRVNYRSANMIERTPDRVRLRASGRVVFRLRGKDVAGLQEFDPSHRIAMDDLDSLGNFETVPPYEKDGVSFPFGRLLRGSTRSFYPDKRFVRMVDAQGQQPAIEIDTSWLYIGHVDETVNFVKAPTPRGWMALVADPRLAEQMLENAMRAGAGDTPMFVGKHWLDDETGHEVPAEVTIAEVLADTQVMQASAEAAAEIDAQLEVLRRELGLADDEIIRVPLLHGIYRGQSIAYQPAMVNALYVSDARLAAPDPHGPVIGGKDIFKAALADRLAAIGISVDWIEDWDAFHRFQGEVHCASNVTRRIPEARWWESGR